MQIQIMSLTSMNSFVTIQLEQNPSSEWSDTAVALNFIKAKNQLIVSETWAEASSSSILEGAYAVVDERAFVV